MTPDSKLVRNTSRLGDHFVSAGVYTEDYEDQLDSIDEDGCVDVPEGPGLGVTLDWDYIEKNTIDKVVYE